MKNGVMACQSRKDKTVLAFPLFAHKKQIIFQLTKPCGETGNGATTGFCFSRERASHLAGHAALRLRPAVVPAMHLIGQKPGGITAPTLKLKIENGKLKITEMKI